MTIKPLADRVLLKACEAEETTASGLFWQLPHRRSPMCPKLLPLAPALTNTP